MKNSLFFAALTYSALSLFYGNTEQVDVGFTLLPVEQLKIFAPLIASVLPLISKIKMRDNTLDLISDLEIKTLQCEDSQEACNILRTLALKRLKNAKAPVPPVPPT